MSRTGGADKEKPSGLPPNWPHSTDEDLANLPTRRVVVGKEQTYSFNSNWVTTSKYSPWNFLPKFLAEEFNPKTKMANVYFLLVATLQTIPQISNTFGVPTTLMPLTFVVVVDGIFAVLEDLARHRADDEANASVAHRFNTRTQEVEDCLWYEVAVGDYVVIRNREVIPADVVILACHEKNSPPEGMCYIETKSLDGETNLKMRQTMPCTLGVVNTVNDLPNLQGEVEMEHPNKLIETFTGTLEVSDAQEKEPIQPTNILLRGCVLRNTEWIIGLVVNTGHDTKIMMSNTETPSKTSVLESRASDEIKRIVLLLCLICTIGTTGATIWNDKNVDDAWYLDWDPNPAAEWFIKFFYFFLLHATFIPVSLYVSMTMIRFFQAYFMNNDLDMYYEETDTPATVRTMTLNEELGQISHIFSDKTGTLTCNIMDFRKCSINGKQYGRGLTEIGKAALKIEGKPIPTEELEAERLAKDSRQPHVNFYDPVFWEDYDEQQSGPQQTDAINQFFLTLAICHTVVAEKVDGRVNLSAASPDDEALVCAAGAFGYSFVDRVEGRAVIDTRDGGQLRIEVLEMLDFTSARKRMSVIVRLDDGRIRLTSKGADTTMLPRLRGGQDDLLNPTVQQMDAFAGEGLRCLVVGYRDIDEAEFAAWRERYHSAIADIDEIEKRKAAKDNAIDATMDEIEQGLTLVGATAIEDKLQDGVPECIADLARARIDLWVLTGDKEETAINISVACNLVRPESVMDRIVVNKKSYRTPDDLRSIFRREIQRYVDEEAAQGKAKDRCLVIDGPSLIDALEPDVCAHLLEFAIKCVSVVCNRVSPDQKRQVVNLVKENVEGVRTLAIGDGANDVAMIQAAHVGVGISGQEGLQAVNSSDYAIAQFAFLKKLLIGHGRWNYRRMCKLICYMFYKNIYMSIAQFWFATRNGFSGQKFYTEAGIQLFNLFFTSLPILLLGSYDQDISTDLVLALPELYRPCIRDFFFRISLFWRWMLWATLDAVMVVMIPLSVMAYGDPNDGDVATFWEYGATTLTIVVISVNFKMLEIQNRWTWVHVLIILISILSWFAAAAVASYLLEFDPDWYGVFPQVLRMPSFWLTNLLVVVIINGRDVLFKALNREFTPQAHHIVQEIEKFSVTMQEALNTIMEHMVAVEGVDYGTGGGGSSAPSQPAAAAGAVGTGRNPSRFEMDQPKSAKARADARRTASGQGRAAAGAYPNPVGPGTDYNHVAANSPHSSGQVRSPLRSSNSDADLV